MTKLKAAGNNTIDLRTGAIISATVCVLAFLILFSPARIRMVDNQQGYSPVQPIDFSHKIHSGDNHIPCLYCHGGAEKGPLAGIPSSAVCMICHLQVKPESEEIKKVALAIENNQPVAWVQVHQLPDFVRFNHSSHVNAGVECQICHGPVELMGRASQFSTLQMGWCVGCHRQYNESPPAELVLEKVAASTDCAICHY